MSAQPHKTRRDVALERLAEASARKRAMTHCHAGHPLSGDNLYVTPKGKRQCRACRRRSQREMYAYFLGRMTIDRDHPNHGTQNGYQAGCRCFRCAVAASEYRRARKERLQ